MISLGKVYNKVLLPVWYLCHDSSCGSAGNDGLESSSHPSSPAGWLPEHGWRYEYLLQDNENSMAVSFFSTKKAGSSIIICKFADCNLN